MRYSTRNHKPRQQSSVNSRLDFDAAKANAALVYGQRGDMRPLPSAHVAVGVPCTLPVGDQQLTSSLTGNERTATGHETDSSDVQLNTTSDNPLSNNHQPLSTNDYSVVENHISNVEYENSHLKCDVELARISVGLKQSAQMRLWIIISEHVRETGFHYISRTDLMAQRMIEMPQRKAQQPVKKPYKSPAMREAEAKLAKWNVSVLGNKSS